MAKLTLKDITSGFLATQVINDNNALIEALVENFLSRDGLAPNTMLATLDMNSNRIINTADPLLAQDAATKSYVDSILAAGIADQGGNAGLFLTTDGSTTSWAAPLPDQTGEAGNFLTTNGTIAAWQGGSFLPDPLVANRLVSNDGATPSWRLDFLLTTNQLAGDNANAGALLNEAAGVTNPTVVPDKTDLDSGLTLAALDSTGIVSGGVLAVSWAEASGEVLQRSQMTTGITANPVQVQGNTPLFSSFNEISISANTGDVVTLPAAVIGQIVTVINNGAEDVAIFPASGEDLGAGVDTSVALSSGGTLQLLGTAAGTYVQAFNLGLFGDFTDTQFCASNILGPCMQNEASSVTNPTFVPNQSLIETGVGSDATGVAMIYQGDTVATFFSLGSAVNFMAFTGATTGNTPLIAAAGADADVDIGISSKGLGDIDVSTPNAGPGTDTAGDIVLLTGDGGITSGAGGAIRLTTGDAVGDGNGGSVIINLGDGVGANTGGNFDVTAGFGGLDTDGGFIELDAGIGDGVASGGGVTIRGGIGGPTSGRGGQIFIQAGLGGNGGQGGDLDLFGGPGSNTSNGGATTIQAGNAGTSSGDGGVLTLQGGQVFAGTGNSGAVILRTRASGTTPGISGTLTISTGSSVSGLAGTIDITGGDSGGANAGAAIILTGGMGGPTGPGGAVTIEGGESPDNGVGGAILIRSGIGGNITGGDSGDVTVITGTSPNDNSGDLILAVGTAAGGALGDILFNRGGVAAFEIDGTLGTNVFHAVNASGPALVNEAISTTNPTLIVDRSSLGTGIGGDGADELSLINAGIESLRIDASGAVQLRQVGGSFRASNASGPTVNNAAASATVPTLIPNRSGSTAGIGANAAGSVSLITASLERLRVDTAGIVTVLGARIEGSVAGSATILNVAPSGTVPNLIPNKLDQDTGIGQDVAGRVSIIGNGAENMRIQAGSAGETRFLIFDEDNGTLERVTVGIADSGGSGFKVLRIPN